MATQEGMVERSDCCRAPVEQGLLRPGTMIDPPEHGDFCSSCGRPCEVLTFFRDDEDGTLADPETGVKGLEDREGRPWLDFGGPDVDAIFDRMREDAL